MILLVTNKRDLTTDFIVVELKRRGVEFFRFNTEDMPSASVVFKSAKGEWTLSLGRRVIALRDVQAAYYRRPGTPEISEDVGDQPTKDYLLSEWSSLLRSLWNALEGRWLNSPFSILRAEDKPRQLAEAVALGFDVPDTLISNDFDEAVAFTSSINAIGKPLRHALIERGETGEVLFTSRVEAILEQDREGVSLAPVIFQREIIKHCDVRVTVVGDSAFAVAIHSQGKAETEVDWRRGAHVDAAHEVIDLPATLVAKCLTLIRQFDLRYGAFDFILDKGGTYWFLEVNPNGQWAWIERRTGLPIAAKIVDVLLGVET